MKVLYMVFLVTVSCIVNAQNILTLEDAVSLALKNNYDIMVARIDAEATKTNNTPGNAGMLPNIEITGSGNYETNNVYQELSDGSINEYPSLSTLSLNAGPQLSWTLYDGGKMFVTKNKLNEIEALGEIQFKDKVLQTIYSVIAAYYNVVRQKQQLASFNEVIELNRERVKIAQAGFNAGSLVKTDLLQAKIDLNVTMENAINQQFVIDAAKKNLSVLLGQIADSAFEVTDSILHDDLPKKEELLQRLDSANTRILLYRKQIEIARLNIREYNTLYLPTINFRGGYYISHTNNSDGSILLNRTFGPQLSGSIIVPLYSAGENKRKVTTAKLQLQSSEYDLLNIKLQVNTEMQNAFTEFENQQQLVQIEKENNELSRENLEICLERLRLGQGISLEVRQAQDDYVQSCTRLTNFEYDLKIAEIKLKQLIASLY